MGMQSSDTAEQSVLQDPVTIVHVGKAGSLQRQTALHGEVGGGCFDLEGVGSSTR